MDEQSVAFTLNDLNSLIREMDSEGLLCDKDYALLTKAHDRIMEIGGFK